MITVALADSDDTFRKKLADYISGYTDVQVVHEAADGDGFLIPLRLHTLPDVALIDIGLPEEYALRITGNFRAYEFKTKIVILSGRPPGLEAEMAIGAGAVSYIDKTADLPVIINAIRSCHRNKMYVYFKKGHWLQKLIGNKLGIIHFGFFQKGNKRIFIPSC